MQDYSSIMRDLEIILILTMTVHIAFQIHAQEQEDGQQSVDGNCEFNDKLPDTYFLRYISPDSYDPLTITFPAITNENNVHMIYGGVNMICQGSLITGDDFIETLMVEYIEDTTITSNYWCFQIKLHADGSAIFTKEMNLGSSFTGTTANCAAELIGAHGTVNPKYPYSTSGIACPNLLDGVYQATINDDSHNGCEDDSASTVSITGNQIGMSICHQGTSTYAKPVDDTLVCAGDFDRGDLDRILLLSRDDGSGHTQYYCAPYCTDGDGRVKMSLHLDLHHSATCPHEQTCQSSGAEYFKLVLDPTETSDDGNGSDEDN